jgi:hypothetical protein
MKKSILILFSLFSFSIAFAQSGYNLEFSQAILIEEGSTLTVPSGKVWKVVSAQLKNDGGYRKQIIINGNVTYTGGTDNGSFPIWLPTGTTISPNNTCQYISVVEFNLISN